MWFDGTFVRDSELTKYERTKHINKTESWRDRNDCDGDLHFSLQIHLLLLRLLSKILQRVNSPLALLFLLDIILSSSRSKQIELIRGSQSKLKLFDKFIWPFKTIPSQSVESWKADVSWTVEIGITDWSENEHSRQVTGHTGCQNYYISLFL